jgi:hypothetical protein
MGKAALKPLTETDVVLDPEWRNIQKSKPRVPGWRAVRTADMAHLEKGYYTDAYFDNGAWWVFGLHAGILSVRKEVRDVEYWRPHTKEERAALNKAAEKERLDVRRFRK